MGSSQSQIRELPESNGSGESGLERDPGHTVINMPPQADAYEPNDPAGGDVERAIEQGITGHSSHERQVELMPSGGSENRDQGDNNESRGSDFERPPHQPNENDPNGPARKDLRSQLPWIAIYIAFMAIQCAILALHFQGSPSPFKTHPAKMWLYLSAVVTNVGAALYCAKSWITGSIHPKICDLVGHISGSMATAAFLSLLVPPSLVPFVFVMWILHLPIYVDAARNWILNAAKNLYGYVSSGAVRVQNIWNRNGGSGSGSGSDQSPS